MEKNTYISNNYNIYKYKDIYSINSFTASAFRLS